MSTKYIESVKCEKCGAEMRHTSVSRWVDRNSSLLLIHDDENCTDMLIAEESELGDFIETEDGSDMFSCKKCDFEVTTNLVEYVLNHPELVTMSEYSDMM